MSCFACCVARTEHDVSDDDLPAPTTPNPNQYNNNNNTLHLKKTLTSATNISIRSDTGRRAVIAKEIAKVGNAKASTRVFTFQELVSATDNFNRDCLVGEGGFGRVYKGYIKNLDNKVVAIKQLDRKGRQGSREFISEVAMLSVVENDNLVNLIGYCAEGEERILVYEFMANGCLENHLLDLSPGKEPLDWDTRLKIALGAAKGLEYLHDVASPPIIYRDFKASNVLLDENMNAKLSDFGLAKIGPTGDSEHVITRVMGTYGYCAPEYALTGQLTTKSDVYSYGVVFMELITGRRVIDTARPSEEQNLITWAEPLLKNKRKFTLLVDPLLEGNYPVKGLHQALAIAAMCLLEDYERRPSIDEVVSALQFLTNPKGNEEEKKGSVRGHSGHFNSLRKSSKR